MIVDVERSAIIHFHGSYRELPRGPGEGTMVYIPGAHGELPGHRAAGLVTDELADAYRRSLAAQFEEVSNWAAGIWTAVPSPLLEQPAAGLVGPVKVATERGENGLFAFQRGLTVASKSQFGRPA